MFSKLIFDKERVYPAFVVSTMSSGKSTLINALIGKELLPSKNQACTAKAVAILDNDRQEKFIAHVVDSQNRYRLMLDADRRTVEDFNGQGNIEELILEGDIKGIKNSKKSLFLIDTPGVNRRFSSMPPTWRGAMR